METSTAEGRTVTTLNNNGHGPRGMNNQGSHEPESSTEFKAEECPKKNKVKLKELYSKGLFLA